MTLSVSPLNGPGLSPATIQQGSPEAKREVLQAFEQLFVKQLVSEMRKSVPDDGLFQRTPAQRYFEQLFDDQLAQAMADSGQLGIADAIANQIDQQEAAKKHQPLAAYRDGLPFHGFEERGARPIPLERSGIPLAAREAYQLPTHRFPQGLASD